MALAKKDDAMKTPEGLSTLATLCANTIPLVEREFFIDDQLVRIQ